MVDKMPIGMAPEHHRTRRHCVSLGPFGQRFERVLRQRRNHIAPIFSRTTNIADGGDGLRRQFPGVDQDIFGQHFAGQETLDDYRKLNNELMRLMVDQQLFTFVTAGSATQPNGETLAVSGTNNEAERTLRNAANARKTGRTSKTARGAKRRTVIESVLESLRVHLPTFTLSSILTEIYRWPENGQSCFTELLKKLQLPPPKTSILEALFS